MPSERSRLWGGGGVGVAALALVAATAGFRCPGPDPVATSSGPGGGGAGGSGGMTGSSSSTSSASTAEVVSSSSADVASSSTDVASSSSADAASSSSSGCMDILGDPLNCGECGRICSSTNVDLVGCSNGVCDSTCLPGFLNVSTPIAPAPDDGCESSPKRVFVTGTFVFATFGGAAGADTTCQLLGQSAFGAGTTWAAWVSDASTSPFDRFKQSLAPYQLVDGTVIANDWTDLTDGTLAHAIDLDQNGTLAQGEVWTGTAASGLPAGLDASCANWTSMGTDTAVVGHSFATNANWSNVFQQFCDRDNVRLYCFEQ